MMTIFSKLVFNSVTTLLTIFLPDTLARGNIPYRTISQNHLFSKLEISHVIMVVNKIQ